MPTRYQLQLEMIDINQQRKENSKQIIADSQYNQIFSPPTNRLTEMNLSGTKTDQ